METPPTSVLAEAPPPADAPTPASVGLVTLRLYSASSFSSAPPEAGVALVEPLPPTTADNTDSSRSTKPLFLFALISQTSFRPVVVAAFHA
jgi:hypothetical protein